MSGGGSKPGERRGGRQAGTPNKVTAELAGLARIHTAEALATLVHIANDPDAPGAARVAAANAVLDRGHGKPRQALEHGGDGRNPIQIVYLDAKDARA
jgi:hypothetical protein